MNVRWLALPAALLCCHIAAAGPDAAPETSAQAPISQVDVEAKRAKLKAMEFQLHGLEDQFFAQYNQFNASRAFKVKCGWEMHRQFRVHVCRPEFVTWSERETYDFTRVGSTTVWKWSPFPVLLREREYQKHLVDLVGKHPELLETLKERAELAKNYKALRDELHAEKAVVWE